MYMTIYNREERETLMKDINRETDFHLYTNMRQVLEFLPKSPPDSPEDLFFNTGSVPDEGRMYMQLEIRELGEDAKESVKDLVKDVSNFFGVEEGFIDTLSFEFV